MTKLISIFDEVKATYFPRWDKADEWRVQRKTKLSDGYKTRAMCNLDKKAIEISRDYVAEDDDELRRLLAHEICHAVVKGYHGKKWQGRFLKVAKRATDLGNTELASKIHNEIEGIKDAETPTLTAIHQQIEDALMTYPEASFEEVIDWVADNWNMTRDWLLKKYKSLNGYFKRVQRAAILDTELQNRIKPMQ